MVLTRLCDGSDPAWRKTTCVFTAVLLLLMLRSFGRKSKNPSNPSENNLWCFLMFWRTEGPTHRGGSVTHINGTRPPEHTALGSSYTVYVYCSGTEFTKRSDGSRGRNTGRSLKPLSEVWTSARCYRDKTSTIFQSEPERWTHRVSPVLQG